VNPTLELVDELNGDQSSTTADSTLHPKRFHLELMNS
jgi:hypothetical protein